ncbi:MAG: PorT family protein [Leadbetterella sp.]|nr:PorT family protein [Leadbetterella sp.]
MKGLISTLITLLAFTGTTLAQKSIGVHYSFPARSTVMTFLKVEGRGSYESKYMYNFGVSYTHGLNKVLGVETGLDYSVHHIILNPAFTGEETPPPTEKTAKLFTVPVMLRVNLGNYVYLNGGPLLDFDLSKPRQISDQTGVGVGVGAGGRYTFKSGLSVFVNPNARLHGLFSFSSGSASYHVVESGVKLGLAYTFAR